MSITTYNPNKKYTWFDTFTDVHRISVIVHNFGSNNWCFLMHKNALSINQGRTIPTLSIVIFLGLTFRGDVQNSTAEDVTFPSTTHD